jgi:predicted NBD/HSP70 family sugar kinase
VSSIVESLLEELWVCESTLIKTARGRRPTLLSLNDDMLFLTADVRPTHIASAVIDLSGRFLERRVIPRSKDVARNVDSLIDVLLQFLQMYPNNTFQGVGVSVPGRVDSETGEIIFAPNLGWPDFALRDRLRERLDLDVQLENAANACLLSELWFGRIDGIRNAMIVTISEGIGAAILADGRLIKGQHGLAGEFGHIVIDPEGPLCGCGAKGCWEVFASSRAAIRAYRELEPNAPPCSILEMHGLAMDGDASARAVLEKQARSIGRGLLLLNAIMSPELILLAGDVQIFYDGYREIINAECRAGAMDGVGPRIVSIGDGEISRLRGAAAVVLQRHSGYYRAAYAHGEPR